jgi:hypothetical protein
MRLVGTRRVERAHQVTDVARLDAPTLDSNDDLRRLSASVIDEIRDAVDGLVSAFLNGVWRFSFSERLPLERMPVMLGEIPCAFDVLWVALRFEAAEFFIERIVNSPRLLLIRGRASPATSGRRTPPAGLGTRPERSGVRRCVPRPVPTRLPHSPQRQQANAPSVLAGPRRLRDRG